MAKVYEIYYYHQVGVSDPLKDKDDIRIALAAEGIFELQDEDVEPGKTFLDKNGDLMMISSYDDGEEDE